MGEKWKQWQILFSWAPKSLQMVTAAMKLKVTAPWKKRYDNPRQHIEKERHYFVSKGPSCQGYGFSRGHVWMWELDYKESWVLKSWCFWTVMLEKPLERPLDSKEIQPVHPKDTVLDVDWKDWCWSWNFNILATWCEGLTHLKRPCCWERFRAGGEGDDTGWDGWMVSPTQWTWVWVNSQELLRSMRLQSRTRLSDWTELKK